MNIVFDENRKIVYHGGNKYSTCIKITLFNTRFNDENEIKKLINKIKKIVIDSEIYVLTLQRINIDNELLNLLYYYISQLNILNLCCYVNITHSLETSTYKQCFDMIKNYQNNIIGLKLIILNRHQMLNINPYNDERLNIMCNHLHECIKDNNKFLKFHVDKILMCVSVVYRELILPITTNNFNIQVSKFKSEMTLQEKTMSLIYNDKEKFNYLMRNNPLFATMYKNFTSEYSNKWSIFIDSITTIIS